MTEQQEPKLRIDPQQFAQEVAQEIAADLGKENGGAKSPYEQIKDRHLPPEEPGAPF